MIARTLVRMAEEDAKPNAERLREYRIEPPVAGTELFSEAPIYNDLETVKLADSLSMFVTLAGADNELVGRCWTASRRAERAAELIQGTRLNDVAVPQLAAGGIAAIRESDDPMIQLALLVDGRRGRPAAQGATGRRAAAAGLRKIAKARFAVRATRSIPTPPSRSAWPSAW